MASLYPTGSGPVTALTNYFSAGGTSSPNVAASVLSNSVETLSGALTATTLKTIHNYSGRGRVNLLHAYTKDGTARTIRVVVIVDGVTIFDATTNSIATTGTGTVPIGIVVATTGALVFQPIDYQSSFVVQIASSLSETDKVATGLNIEVWA